MKLLQKEKKSPPSTCHYIPSRKWRFRYFFATDLNQETLAHYLDSGWRKFGYYFFRPDCDGCRECIPVRIKTTEFQPSRSQKRILRKNVHIQVSYAPMIYDESIFNLYRKHSLNRFGKNESDKREFLASFFTQSCPAGLSLYFQGKQLIGTGFLDYASEGVSSVYFIYDTDFSHLSPGVFSIISEISYAKSIGKPYYYLGYYIGECQSMAYKNKFRPYEFMDWESGLWSPPETT